MQIQSVKSLLWLARWYNGRSERLAEIHQTHLAALTILVLEELGGTPVGEVDLTLYGFTIRVRPSPQGLVLLFIAPPALITGEQLALFSDNELAVAIVKSQPKPEAIAYELVA